jgi:uncharacterized protein (DUF427 family)
MKAIWNDEIIAEADQTLVVEGKHYFPQDTVKVEYLSASDYCEECPWKGMAKYFDLEVSGKDLFNAVWYYPNPKEEAVHITGYMAFSNEVHLID